MVVCRKSGSMCVICSIAVALGILLGAVFPSGCLVPLLCLLLIVVGVLMLL